MSENFVSRAGHKLDAALDAFGLDVRGMICADFGCNVGGFTQCLLRRGAAKVYAIDTGYGALAWELRKDPRVEVMERTNVLHCPVVREVDLVTIDVAWTPQRLSVPAAATWLAEGGKIISLLKPHYELTKMQGRKPVWKLEPGQADGVCLSVCETLESLGIVTVNAVMRSLLVGKGGNREYLLWIEPAGRKKERKNNL